MPNLAYYNHEKWVPTLMMILRPGLDAMIRNNNSSFGCFSA